MEEVSQSRIEYGLPLKTPKDLMRVPCNILNPSSISYYM